MGQVIKTANEDQHIHFRAQKMIGEESKNKMRSKAVPLEKKILLAGLEMGRKLGVARAAYMHIYQNKLKSCRSHFQIE